MMQFIIKDIGQHLTFQDTYGTFQKKSIKRLFSEVDMNLDCVLPMWFDSFMLACYLKKQKGKLIFLMQS